MINLSTVEGRLAFLEDAAAMRELAHSSLWTVFLRHAQWEAEAVRERTMTGSKEEFDYNKGMHEGMLALLRLPGKILYAEEQLKNARG